MERITSIKELQTVCDNLYVYFVDRLAQVTETEITEYEHFTVTNLYIFKGKNYYGCLNIYKWNNGNLSFFADGYNGLLIGTYSDHDAISIFKTNETINDRGFRVLEEKRYSNKNGQKTADLKKRAILLDLKAKLDVLFKDYL